MQTIKQFIDALGGTAAVASELSLTASTVSSWKTAGSVPKWRRPDLSVMAAKRAVPVPRDWAEK